MIILKILLFIKYHKLQILKKNHKFLIFYIDKFEISNDYSLLISYLIILF